LSSELLANKVVIKIFQNYGNCYLFSISGVKSPPSANISTFFYGFLKPDDKRGSFLKIYQKQTPVFRFRPFRFAEPSTRNPTAHRSDNDKISK
ncbi:hypothetical protein, partial [Alistipes finegoldii]|uniref:hypothetical protein n=1 Tax=Alistipes finegoldii TaxID=214856 RepID=UPI00266EE7CF